MPVQRFAPIDYRLRTWTVDSAASTVQVVVGDGLAGMRLLLKARAGADDWDAIVVSVGDAGPPFERVLGRAGATPIECADTARSAPLAV